MCQPTYWLCQKNPEAVAGLLSPVPRQAAMGMLQCLGLLHSHQHCAGTCSSFRKHHLDIQLKINILKHSNSVIIQGLHLSFIVY